MFNKHQAMILSRTVTHDNNTDCLTDDNTCYKVLIHLNNNVFRKTTWIDSKWTNGWK